MQGDKMNLIKIASMFFRNKNVFVGVPVIIKNSNGYILLGKRNANAPFYPSTWGLPGGMVEYGEKIEDAAIREAEEEIGVKIRIIRKSNNIYENFPNRQCRIHTIDIPYYAKIVNGFPKPKDETSEIGWFSPSSIENMFLAYSHKEILKGEGLIE